jgi:3-phenylpropionate/trans-cinnamate dioxygenase ferredoxin component
MTTICKLDELGDGAVRRFDVNGVFVAVVRVGDRVFAVNDVCSHANVSLSGGEVWCDELELECPKHGSAFSLLTGEAITLPATQPVAVYPATVVDGSIEVDVATNDVGGHVGMMAGQEEHS